MKIAILVLAMFSLTMARSGPMEAVENYYSLSHHLPPLLQEVVKSPKGDIVEKDFLIKAIIYHFYEKVLTGKALSDHENLLAQYSWFSGSGMSMLPQSPNEVLDTAIHIQGNKALVSLHALRTEMWNSLEDFAVNDLKYIYASYHVVKPEYSSFLRSIHELNSRFEFPIYEVKCCSEINIRLSLEKIDGKWMIINVEYIYKRSILDLALN